MRRPPTRTAPGRRSWLAVAGDKRTRLVAVVNQGISGNQVLRNGAGLSMLARFDRDVLSRPGVKWVVLLGGINDINIRGRFGNEPLTAEQLIDGYEQIIARSHAHGIRVVGATVTPQEGQRAPPPRRRSHPPGGQQLDPYVGAIRCRRRLRHRGA